MRNESERDKVLRIGRDSLKMLDKDQNWSWWMDVGEAILLLREEAMAEAVTNRPEGGAYDRIFGEKLRDEKLDFDKGDRSRLFSVMDNRAAIEEWRATLTTSERRKLNHPSTVWRKWKAATTIPEDREKAPSKSEKLLEVNLELVDEVDRLKAHIADLEASREERLAAAETTNKRGQKQDQKGERCSFCEKKQAQVLTLIHGHGAAICDQCVEESARIVAERKKATKTSKAKPTRQTKADKDLDKISRELTKAINL